MKIHICKICGTECKMSGLGVHLFHKHNLTCKDYYDNIKFDSSYEMIYYIWLKDHNINFIYHPEPIEYKINEKTHYYYPDFIVENEIIELKSTYYLNNLETDEKGLCKLKCMQDNNVKIITDVSEFLKHIKLNYCKNTRKFIRQFRIQKEGSNGLSKNI